MASLIKAVREAEKSIICTGKEGISTNSEVYVKGEHNISHIPLFLTVGVHPPPRVFTEKIYKVKAVFSKNNSMYKNVE